MAEGGVFMQRNQFGMRDCGHSTTVPDHPKAHLMYYLNSIASLLDLNNPNLSRLKNYARYQWLSEEETDALLKIVLLLSPDELIGKVLFPSDELCGDRLNKFFELTHASHLIAAVQNTVVIGGQRKRVMQIMAFKMRWLQVHYLQPIARYQYRLSRIARRLPGYEPPRVVQNTSASCAIL